MINPKMDNRSSKIIYMLVGATGLATLSWEVLWQIKSTLALGVSAWGAALTLATTMGGLCAGSLLMGSVLRDRTVERPVRIYGALEIIVGLCGFALAPVFRIIEHIDTLAYARAPESASVIHILGIIAALGIPTMCMGATLPAFGLMSRQFKTSIALLYGLNTLGAAVGAILVAFLLIPQFGVMHASWIVASINILVGVVAWALNTGAAVSPEALRPVPVVSEPINNMRLIVFVTGFATFMLEVAWFRSFIATFHSTTDAFAIMVTCVLIALGFAARLVPKFKQKKIPLGVIIGCAGALILLITPLIERFDLLTTKAVHATAQATVAAVAPLAPAAHSHDISMVLYIQLIINWFVNTLFFIGPPILLLGIPLPWILEEQDSARKWSRLYAINTFAAIIGSVAAAWLFLPTIGFARTSWVAGIIVLLTGLSVIPKKYRLPAVTVGIVSFLIAVFFHSDVGTGRVQGQTLYANDKPIKVLEYYEGPEATVSAIEYSGGARALMVDGFVTATQLGGNGQLMDHYMAWMGHLPMLLAPDPKNALVICFGTGQTSNAVRMENPQSLDIVDINPRVFRLAHNFAVNEDVLHDPRVKTIIMDGRAYVRRTPKTYNVITLEPMPPNFAGVNALYSEQFYEFAREKLSPHGVIAQWVPFHILSPLSSASIARTFRKIFPNAILWIDPNSSTGILLGSKDDNPRFGDEWPGFSRTALARDLSEDQVRKAILLNQEAMKDYAEYGKVIDDDNQLLAYGREVSAMRLSSSLNQSNFDLLNQVKK